MSADTITFVHKGSFKNIRKFLKTAKTAPWFDTLDDLGKVGVEALSSATPRRTGKTAASWSYEITKTKAYTMISWTNSSTTPSGIPIVILLKYGHGTRNGGFVEGEDFITPAIKPIFDEIADKMWEEVQKS